MITPLPLPKSKLFDEFRTFISRGNVVDLAVGIIIGAAFTAIVNSLVTDIVMPPIGLLTGKVDFANKFVALTGGDFATLADAQKAGAVTVNYGLFVNAVIKFLIVSFVVFLLVRQVNKLKEHALRKEKAEEAAAPPSRSEILLEEIRNLLQQRS